MFEHSVIGGAESPLRVPYFPSLVSKMIDRPPYYITSAVQID
jgi:hypothetical protein